MSRHAWGWSLREIADREVRRSAPAPNQTGAYQNMTGNLVITDLAKFASNSEQGTAVEFQGELFTLQGDTFGSSAGDVLVQDSEGNLKIEGPRI